MDRPLNEITGPVHVWHGEQDSLVPISAAHVLADACPTLLGDGVQTTATSPLRQPDRPDPCGTQDPLDRGCVAATREGAYYGGSPLWRRFQDSVRALSKSCGDAGVKSRPWRPSGPLTVLVRRRLPQLRRVVLVPCASLRREWRRILDYLREAVANDPSHL
jgi:hypothetical protein